MSRNEADNYGRRKTSKWDGLSPVERFWRLVEKLPGDGCWLWRGSCYPDGYGKFKLSNPRRDVRATHFAYELKHGPLPAGMSVLHHCDNPPCVRDDHLFPGTQLDNMRDRKAKGRMPIGEAHRLAKLTEAGVRSIRREFAKGATKAALARAHSVDPKLISNIVLRKTWKHVQDEAASG